MNEALSQIGPRQREHHFHLIPSHRCYYWGEYTPWAYTRGKNAAFSETNSLIADLKVSPELRDTPDWVRKQQAIALVGSAFARFWRWRGLHDKCILVPIPSSRRRDDALYDDRMEQVLEHVSSQSGARLSVVPVLESDGSLQPSHNSSKRPKLPELIRSLHIRQAAVPTSAPKMVFLFDDVLTTGAHFVACYAHLQRILPHAKIIGNFVARSRRPEADE